MQQALGIFSKHKVNLTRLESRPSVTNENGYEFFASTDSSGDELSSCLDELKATVRLLRQRLLPPFGLAAHVVEVLCPEQPRHVFVCAFGRHLPFAS